MCHRNACTLRMAAVICTASGIAGCSTVGITSINQGRTPYNEVIQDTAKEQTLLNIVRVSNGESPLFLDVSEVDQATTVVGSLTGGPSGIGASPGFNSTAGTVAGLIGSATGSASYQEAPTVRYIPLSGQALIAQVATPLSPEAIANLTNSDWDLASVLTFGIDRITPGYLDYDAAVDALIEQIWRSHRCSDTKFRSAEEGENIWPHLYYLTSTG